MFTLSLFMRSAFIPEIESLSSVIWIFLGFIGPANTRISWWIMSE